MGNTRQHASRQQAHQDHPHIHGEYPVLVLTDGGHTGSPPHTWGIHKLSGDYQKEVRITPTYMGNTLLCRSAPSSVLDHPHIHGEYYAFDVDRLKPIGSPPHTWGILMFGILNVQQVRITPTYMGNTGVDDSGAIFTEDHPHIHGEYSNLAPQIQCIVGSPPHTWGIHYVIPTDISRRSITPTYMGNTQNMAAAYTAG